MLPLDQHLFYAMHSITTTTKLEWNYPSNCKFDDDVYSFHEGVNVACKAFSWWLEKKNVNSKNMANIRLCKRGLKHDILMKLNYLYWKIQLSIKQYSSDIAVTTL